MASALDAAIVQANAGFYRAFRKRDADAMSRLWASECEVSCIHPGMAPVFGRDAVLASWRGILRHPGAPVLECSAERVQVLGTSAILTCLEGEHGALPKLVATNAFVLESGRWRMVHHHGAALLRPVTKTAERSMN